MIDDNFICLLSHLWHCFVLPLPRNTLRMREIRMYTVAFIKKRHVGVRWGTRGRLAFVGLASLLHSTYRKQKGLGGDTGCFCDGLPPISLLWITSPVMLSTVHADVRQPHSFLSSQRGPDPEPLSPGSWESGGAGYALFTGRGGGRHRLTTARPPWSLGTNTPSMSKRTMDMGSRRWFLGLQYEEQELCFGFYDGSPLLFSKSFPFFLLL